MVNFSSSTTKDTLFPGAYVPLGTLYLLPLYKTILSLPMMNKYKARSLYKKEQKAKKVNNNYVKKSNYFQHSLGYIFNTYYMPKDVINSFKKFHLIN